MKIFRLFCPEAGKERDSVNQLFFWHQFQGIFNSLFNISQGSDRTGISARIMLVIAHNNYIVGYNSLLSAVIETIIRGRNIIVYRQHEALLPAGHGKLSDKLYIVYPGLLLQTLKSRLIPSKPYVSASSIRLSISFFLTEVLDSSSSD